MMGTLQTVNHTVFDTIVAAITVTVLGVMGLTRTGNTNSSVNSVAPININMIGAAAVPAVQVTIYSSHRCLPCKKYIKAVRAELPADGWLVRDATDADSSTAHVIVSYDETIVDKFKIESWPTTIIRRNGKEVDRFTGYLSPTALADRINKAAK